ncbi:hypothetical protein HPP92_013672 [Vanilla planifolia]|uniref:FHA domain-containing protein n=1 Tax=Vanilla planifolia TaxID=51239 RepID=A0A835R2V9_VANPL|nr:hypothetical protein HPP92_013672 [Vanilla planifolia]
MEIPNLILSIDDGPKKGEIIDCRPGCLIRIGRVVRGNTFAIKDSGISQKHLVVEFNKDVSRWAVTDLGSSNGTSVNGTLISPNSPTPLGDGDIINIGGSSLISVKICMPYLASEPRTRRGRRAAAAGVCVKEENVVEGERVEEPSKRMAVERKKGKPMRCAAASISTSSTKEQEEVKNNADEAIRDGPNRRARRKKSGSSAGSSRNIVNLEPVVVEGNYGSVVRTSVNSATVSKDVQEGVGYDNIDGLNNAGKGVKQVKSLIRPARVSRKQSIMKPELVGRKIEMASRAFSVANSTEVMSKVEEQLELVEKKGRGKGTVRATADVGSVMLSQNILEPVLVENRRGRVTRASARAMHFSTLVSEEFEEEFKEMNEEKLEHAKNRGKQKAKLKKGGRSAKISSKSDIVKPGILEGKTGSMITCSDVSLPSSSMVLKELQVKKLTSELNSNSDAMEINVKGISTYSVVGREAGFLADDVENYNDNMMIPGQINKTEGNYFHNNRNWLIVGVPSPR